MSGILSTIGIIWRLAVPYFRSDDRWAGRILLAAVVAMELATVTPSRKRTGMRSHVSWGSSACWPRP